jgi:pimeloyl-ACP methyl ester carboxylesterase
MAAMSYDIAYATAAARWPDGTGSIDVPTSWGRTHALTAGPSDAPVVVLLHGDGATATAWAGVAARLCDHHRVVAPDQPGNPGRSASSRRFRRTADLVSWVHELVDATDTRPVHLAGHSAGAHLALEFALAHGDQVASLTLLDPTFCFAGVRPGYLLRALPMLVRPTPRGVRRFLAWETRGRDLDPDWERVFVEGATDFEGAPIVRTRRPAGRRLAALRLPVLVVVGGRSRAHHPRRVTAAAAAVLPDVALAEVPEATHHTVPVLDAGEIARLVAGHVEAHPAT